ncbi:MAG TPA: type IV toxin-antitoxin system AbiEi family antitoxin domain-containing protein [Solirubrobacterales bacterium]|nr:type IV toxin-antitoxin system AbiEi family antitoxin domain-containing protein [Solirubrobacterales bacterium]
MRTASKLAELAEDQWGLLTRRQAEASGVSPATLQRLSAPDGVLERRAQGVYHLAGAPLPDHAPLRAAWLALAPETLAWERRPEQGVVSHRSAASVYGIGHLSADRQEFTLPARRQTRRKDVRLHRRELADAEWKALRGLPVTRPSRIAADLLGEREDPEAVAQVVVDAIRNVYDYPGTFAEALSPAAARLGFRPGDGLAVLRWLLELADEPETQRWLGEARSTVEHDAA